MRACKPLVATIIIREVISCLSTFTKLTPSSQLAKTLSNPLLAHYITYNPIILIDTQ